MTYFPDLTRYAYIAESPNFSTQGASMVNVGWLGGGHSFPTSDVNEEFAHAILLRAFDGCNRCRGYHNCEFCDVKSPIEVETPDRTRRAVLGMSEIHVLGADGTRFSAPSLIVHYVTAHQYDPPQQFKDSILRAVREFGYGPAPYNN